MRPVIWLVGAGIASWLAASVFLSWQTSFEVLCGMLGPLAAVSASWLLADWFCRRRPAAITHLMIAAFGAKVVFFGVYVAVMLRVLSLRPIPFVASFTSYFIVLYLIEALYLRRLFWRGMHPSR